MASVYGGKNTSWNTNNETPYVVTTQLGTYDDYKNNKLFYGLVLNDNTHEIDRAYICGHDSNGRVLCFEGNNGDSSKYTKNVGILQSFFDTKRNSYPNSSVNTYYFSSSPGGYSPISTYDGEEFVARIGNDGYVFLGYDDWSVSISSSGNICTNLGG